MKRVLKLIIVSLVLLVFGCSSSNTKQDINNPNEQFTKIDDGKIIKITKADFLTKIADYENNPNEWKFKDELPCIVDFYADWCRPCKIASPILDELAIEYAGKINIYKVNIDEEQALANAFGIQNIPAFLICPSKGQPQMMSGISSSKDETKKMFIQAIEKVLLNKK